ncbi:MAG: laccase domain-containing protein [Acidimicrobiaceae bacterium]|nr:laccase domain-containing protein [Acidimicrobiaceae bacterium]
MPVDLRLTPEVRGPLSVYPFFAARDLGVDAFVTDRFGGVSDGPYDSLNLGEHVGDDPSRVRENRRRVATAAGVDLADLIIVHQVHGHVVARADTVTPDTNADSLITSSTRHALAILVADCLPVLLVDTSSDQIALVHAGWRGLRGGVLASSLACFADPARVHAFIGPSISAEGYQVGPEVAQHFIHIDAAVLSDVGDRSRLDLRRVAIEQLRTRGVAMEHMSTSTQSTNGGETFFSDRALRPCGRFALVARRTS